MAYQLDAFTVFQALRQIDAPAADQFKRELEGLLTNAARRVAKQHKFFVGFASLEEPEVGGLLIPARAGYAGQLIPDVILHADHLGEWN